MLPGPVFTFEMMTTARRGRFYALRALYAVVLLLILWLIQSIWMKALGSSLTIAVVPWFGLSALAGILIGQAVLVVALTPSLVAGAIAGEKRRKTLHYLLASRLSGPEIVLGKLLVRMLYVGVLLSVSFPVMSLLVLLGGVDPGLVVVGCAALFSTAWVVAALSIWVSTVARSPREAMFAAYGLEGLWLGAPWIIHQLMPTHWDALDEALFWMADAIGATTPIYQFDALFTRAFIAFRISDWEGWLLRMIGLQAAIGAVLAILAAVQLRRAFRRQDGGDSRPRRWIARLSAPGPRRLPSIGERPMLWKELHTGRARGFARLVGGLLTLVLGGLLLYNGVWVAILAYLELWENGYSLRGGWPAFQERWQFQNFLIDVVPLVYLAGIMVVAGSAAASISSEHEDDTWVSLTSTDLTGREIVVSKVAGALWRGRWLAEVIGMMLLAGIGAGAVHPLALVAMPTALVVYAWAAAALGVWVSIQLRSTWRAQFLTLSLFLLVGIAGQGVITLLAPHGYPPAVWPGLTPHEIAKLILDPRILDWLREARWPRFWRLWDVDETFGWQATFSLMSLLGYAILASVLTWDALRRFENVAGRARPAGGIAPLAVERRQGEARRLPAGS